MKIFLYVVILSTILASFWIMKRSKMQPVATHSQQLKTAEPSTYRDGQNYENAVIVVGRHMSSNTQSFEDVWTKIPVEERNFNKKTAEAGYKYITELEEPNFSE